MTDVPVFESHRLEELRSLGTLSGVPLVENLLTSFLDALPAKVAGLHEAIAAGDAPALKFAAHSLKASSAQLGAAAMAAVLLRLEHAGIAEARPLMDALAHEIDRITPIFKAQQLPHG